MEAPVATPKIPLARHPLLGVLACPETGQALRVDGDALTTADGARRYPIVRDIPRHKARIFPLSNMAMLELLRGMRPGLTVHGFRSTFMDWAHESTNHPTGESARTGKHFRHSCLFVSICAAFPFHFLTVAAPQGSGRGQRKSVGRVSLGSRSRPRPLLSVTSQKRSRSTARPSMTPTKG